MIDMMKEELKKVTNNKLDEKIEGDYNTAYDVLLQKINLGFEGRVKNFSSTLYGDIKECTKILRYTLKQIFCQDGNQQIVFVIDNLWKIMLLSIETILEYEVRKINEAAEQYKQNLAQEREKYKQRLIRLQERDSELELEYTIKKEQCDSELLNAVEAKKRLEARAAEKTHEVEDLLDPSRFIYLHHFLSEFSYKFEYTNEDRLEQLKNTKSILEIMIDPNNITNELNDELCNVSRPNFPKHILMVLRKLQEYLGISNDEIKSKMKRTTNIIASVMEGTTTFKKCVNEFCQTDPLKDSDSDSGVYIFYCNST